MEIKEITSAADWAKEQTKTKSGWFVLFIILMTLSFLAILWLVNDQRVTAISEKAEAQKQVAVSIERESRIKAECAKTMREYFDMFKELGAQFSGNLMTVRAMEAETSAAVRQQQSIIFNAMNDEKN